MNRRNKKSTRALLRIQMVTQKIQLNKRDRNREKQKENADSKRQNAKDRDEKKTTQVDENVSWASCFLIFCLQTISQSFCIGYPYHNEFNLSQHATNIPNNLFSMTPNRRCVYLCMHIANMRNAYTLSEPSHWASKWKIKTLQKQNNKQKAKGDTLSSQRDTRNRVAETEKRMRDKYNMLVAVIPGCVALFTNENRCREYISSASAHMATVRA